ncbi:acyltransferase [Vibrio vulnificus]|nr:acyltransferase [Vibrio vulnificus]HAS6329548.1 acyltransferase family protein [Vibrio vulnificus]HDY7567187.1 acyltransferase [Vibrio vulnificus]
MINSIQVLRALAALAVVFYHLFAVQDKYFSTLELPYFFKFGKSGVDMFFVISGFIMVLVTKDIKPGFESAKKFIIKRLIRIYPIYWVYSFLVLIVYMMYPSLVNSSQGGQVNIIESFLLLPQDVLPLLMVGWTLTYEVYFYLLFFLCALFLNWRNFPLFFLFLSIAILVVNDRYENAYLNVLFNPLVLEFLLGSVLAYFYICFIFSKRHVLTIFVLSIIVFASSFSYVYINEMIDNLSDFERFFYFGVPSSFVLLSIVLLEREYGLSMPKILVILGDSSYSLYLSHILVINAYCLLWDRIFPAYFINDLVKMLTLIVVVIIYSYLSFVFLERNIASSLRCFLQTKAGRLNKGC